MVQFPPLLSALLPLNAAAVLQFPAAHAQVACLLEHCAGALAAFGFPLTHAQERSLGEIRADMAAPHRMLRLLQGDVGSGKTVVALLAMLTAVETGAQAALMAPTEILARQHLATIGPLAAAIGIEVAVLTGRDKGQARAAARACGAPPPELWV